MSKIFCEQAVAPGIVVALKHSTDLSLSTWGVTVPYAHWALSSQPDVIERFNKHSENYPQIPVLEFDNGEEWKLRFAQFPQNIVPLCWLDDFLSFLSTDSKAVPMTLWACSRRDGSRYYRELLGWLPLLARGASKDFTSEDLKEEVWGVKNQLEHSQAIYKWKLEHPDWRNWKTVYEPDHRFHFTIS